MPALPRARSLWILAVALVCSTFACVGDDASTSSQPASGTDAGTADGGDGGVVPGSEGGGPTTHAIGGTVHFLQAGGALELSNGADTLSVTAAGAFTFPKRAADGDPYDVKIVNNPVGQRCSLRTTGAGTAKADVSVTIGCSLARSVSSPSGAESTTTSTAFADIPSIPPVTFTTDVASNVLVALNLGAIRGDSTNGTGLGATVGIDVDGTVVGQGRHAIAVFAISHSFATFEVVPVPAGTHTIKARWKADAGATSVIANAFANSLSAVVLESLGSFASAKSTASALTASSTATIAPLGLSDLSVTAPSGSLLTLLHVPTVAGAGGGAFQLSVGGTKVASASTSGCGVSDFTFSPAVLAPVVAGAQTVSAQWTAFGAPDFKLAGAQTRMDAIAFDATAGGKTVSATGDVSVTSTTLSAIPSLGTVVLSPAADSQALVILQIDDVYTEGNGQPGLVTLSMDGTTSLGEAFLQSQNSNCARPATIFAVTPVKVGPRTFGGNMKIIGNQPIHVNRQTTLSAMLLE